MYTLQNCTVYIWGNARETWPHKWNASLCHSIVSDKEKHSALHSHHSYLTVHQAARTQHSFSLRLHPHLSITGPHRWVRKRAWLWSVTASAPGCLNHLSILWAVCLSSSTAACIITGVQGAFTVGGKSLYCLWSQIKTSLTDKGEGADVSGRVWLCLMCIVFEETQKRISKEAVSILSRLKSGSAWLRPDVPTGTKRISN